MGTVSSNIPSIFIKSQMITHLIPNREAVGCNKMQVGHNNEKERNALDSFSAFQQNPGSAFLSHLFSGCFQRYARKRERGKGGSK